LLVQNIAVFSLLRSIRQLHPITSNDIIVIVAVVFVIVIFVGILQCWFIGGVRSYISRHLFVAAPVLYKKVARHMYRVHNINGSFHMKRDKVWTVVLIALLLHFWLVIGNIHSGHIFFRVTAVFQNIIAANLFFRHPYF